jgi:hypothetical protein
MSNGFYVVGLLYDSPEKPKSTRTAKVDLDELPQIIRDTIGLGVCVEHKLPSIGKVLDVSVTIDGDGVVLLFVDTSSIKGKQARLDVMNKKLCGLSFDSLALFTPDGLRHSRYKPSEVSLVKEGGVDRAYIVLWGDHYRDLHCSLPRFHDVFTKTLSKKSYKMSDSKTPSNAIETVTVAPIEPNQEQIKEALTVYNVFKSIGVTPSNVHEFATVANNVIKNGTKSYESFLKGDGENIGIVDYANEHLPAEEVNELKKDLEKMMNENIGYPPALIRVCASLLGDYQEVAKKGKETQHKMEMMEKTVVKPITNDDRKVINSDVITHLHEKNRQVLEDAFSYKRQRVMNVQPDIAPQKAVQTNAVDRAEVEKMLKNARPNVTNIDVTTA